MRRATTVGLALCLTSAAYAMACAQQEEGIADGPSVGAGNNASGGSSGSTATGGKSGGSTANSGTGGTGGSTAHGGTTASAGAGGDPAAGGSSDGPCTEHADCDDDEPCTDDACNLGACQHVPNTGACGDDGDPCTDDVCDEGACTHPDNGVCECEEDVDCNDQEPCTTDTCGEDRLCNYEPNTDPCTDDDNECTEDVCGAGSCQHLPINGACTADGTDCTDDVCVEGSCQHVDNMSCECLGPGDCEDNSSCTFNRCSAGGTCSFVDNDSCDVGDDFVVNSFNSSADWNSGGAGAGVTTPAQAPLTYTGMNANLEGNANLWFADADGATLTMGVASMAGLDRLAITIQSASENTASMVKVGVFNGSWHEVTLSSYGQITQNQYGTLEIPLLDFGVPLGTITQVRLVTTPVPSGIEKVWKIDHIEVRDQ